MRTKCLPFYQYHYLVTLHRLTLPMEPPFPTLVGNKIGSCEEKASLFILLQETQSIQLQGHYQYSKKKTNFY